MTNIQLIATDLDGTFLADDKTFDKALFKVVLERLKAKNIGFVIATGVHQERIEMLLADFLHAGLFYVTNNGARVIAPNGEVLYNQAIPWSVLAQIQTLITAFEPKPDQGLVYSTDDTAYIPRSFSHLATDDRLKYFKKVILFDDVSEIVTPIFKVTMNWIDFDESKLYAAAKQALGHQVHVTETGTGAIDIVPAGVNKAVGLKVLADNLGIQLSQVAAFGDGGNDIEMLTHVGYPYIMPNTKLSGVLRTILTILDKSSVS